MAMKTILEDKKCGNFSVQLKPVGSACNIKCTYCYVEPFKTGKLKIMDEKTLEETIRKALENSDHPTFSWHGGEPTMAGIDFFEKAMRAIKKYRRKGQKVRNMLQTNGTLITPEFAKLLKKNNFGVSISIDGPGNIHGIHRKTHSGKNSFKAVMRGLNNLNEARIFPSVICTVTQTTLSFAVETLHFLLSCGFKKIKFSPVFDSERDIFNITSEDWYKYLSTIFDEWFFLEDSSIQIRELDEVILWLNRKKLSLCSSDQSCLSWISIDSYGDMYPCEYMRSKYSYGNIASMSLDSIRQTKEYAGFQEIFKTIPQKCRECKFYDLCGNGCPATRIHEDKIDPHGIYVYCEERKMLYNKIKECFEKELGYAL